MAGDAPLRLALEAIVLATGRPLVADRTQASYVVADHPTATTGAAMVAVVETTPFAAYVGINGLLRGTVDVLVARHQLHHLPAALAAFEHGSVGIPRALLAARRRLPRLSARQHLVLAHLVGDVGDVGDIGDDVQDQVLADRLGVSVPILQRDLQHICHMLGVTGRRHARDAARHLGYALPFALDRLA